MLACEDNSLNILWMIALTLWGRRCLSSLWPRKIEDAHVLEGMGDGCNPEVYSEMYNIHLHKLIFVDHIGN